jgi:hypothetical protein
MWTQIMAMEESMAESPKITLVHGGIFGNMYL